MAQRDGEVAFIEVKAMAAPSPQVFTHSVRRLKRIAAGHPEALLVLVMPGPVPENIQDLAWAGQISMLVVRVDRNTMRIEELSGTSNDHLSASA